MGAVEVPQTETLFEPSAFVEHAKQPRSAAAAPMLMAVQLHADVENDDPVESPFVLQLQGPIDFSGERGDHIEIGHKENMELAEGTISLSFTADTIWGRQALFSKDFSDNRDGGDLTAFVRDGRIEVRLQSEDESVWLKSAPGSVVEGQEHQLAITFGDDGFWLYIDGEMKDWETDFTQGLTENNQNLVIGANTWSRSEDRPDKTQDNFDGRISDFTIYNRQFDHYDVAELAGIEPEDPFDQPTVVDGILYGTQGDDQLDAAAFDVNQIRGDYGDDILIGTDGNDILDGGHGEDRLEGGAGDDLLISRSDGREPVIDQEYGRDDDPDREIDRLTNTYYSDQPIIADDIMIGGAGADTFRFEVLINAKEDIILDHVMDNGMIHWHGVAGENDRVHDHWVDRLGNEVIWDFNRAEGDKIEVVGHTVDVYKIEHVDSDQDGMLDASVLYVQSNQGNAGAHNKDQLGTITVFGDFVVESDITVNAAPAYGIVDHIRDLDEAITPVHGIPVRDGDEPPATPTVDDGELPDNGVFGYAGTFDFIGQPGDHIEVAHRADLELDEGTVSLNFSVDTIWGRQALFSKDFSGNRDGGDVTAFVRDGRIEVRLQSAEESVWLKTTPGSVVEGQEHHLAITFGDEGFWLYLDGEMKDWDSDFTQGLSENTQALVIGANTWARTEDRPDKTWDNLDGRIGDFTIFDSQFSHEQVASLAGVDPDEPLDAPTVINGVLTGTLGDDTLDATAFGVTQIHGSYGDDLLIGTEFDDILDGGHGEDRLEGGDGDDLLISRSDGREPQIAQLYDGEDDPDNEIDPLTRTYYSDQPIVADDILIGGAGADTFRFEVLINAKEDIILDHVMDNGMIHWHGVAGENDRVHDHWVDRLGNEVIWDFSRAEGDRIEVVGHTVDVYHLEHIDSDNDGMLDASVMYVQSNQGNAGAHNKDQLGTITVFGDLVMESDYIVDAGPAYGIVDNIRDLGEAITPLRGTPVSLGDEPPATPMVDDGELPDSGIFGFGGSIDFTGEHGDHIEVAHKSNLELSDGTVAMSFEVDSIWGRQALFSKDFSDNRDGGDLTAFVRDGRIEVRLQSAEESVWLKTNAGSVVEGQEHHIAITFGEDGFWLYLDGEMKDWETEFTQGLSENTQNLVIGANGWSRNEDRPYKTWGNFAGQITDFTIFGTQMDRNQVATLAGVPQDEPLDIPTVINGVLYGTEGNNILSAASHGVNQVQGDYGDDTILGSDGDDILDGGHGEDRLEGGAGDDLLISRADGREPRIAQLYDAAEDDPYGEINPSTLTHYPYQPILSDDILIGGEGADTFRFETLINAKERIILEHVMDDGRIHWHGVAGENDNVHDHWAERIGNEVIWDFSRAEGDKIEIAGHTVDVYKLEHVDTNDDGVLDATVIHLQSNQGNAGAHNKDKLGTITVFGDLVTENDYTVDAAPAYGIVDHISELDEALAPKYGTPISEGDAPPATPEIDVVDLPEGTVFGFNGEVTFSGDRGDHLEVAHDESMELAEGTFAMTFSTDNIWERQAIFSKDFSGNRDGGDLTAFIKNGHLEVRFQSADESVWLCSEHGTIEEGEEYHLAVTFGAGGVQVYLNGVLVDSEESFTQGMEMNTQNLVIGANSWARSEDRPTKTWDYFSGEIADFTLSDRQFSAAEVAAMA